MKLDPNITPYIKINFKWITDTSIKLLRKKNWVKSLGSRTQWKILRLDTKSMIYTRKKFYVRQYKN